jgi:DNA polymerase III subunit epsilon
MVVFDPPSSVERRCGTRNIREMDPTLEQLADALVESGDYRVIRRLKPRTEYHPPDDAPKLLAAVVDVETTGIDPEHDKIIELGMCVFEYGRNDGQIYRMIGSWDWLEDPEIPLPPEITRLTGITDQMVAGHRIDDAAVNDLLGKVVLVIAHHAAFDRGFLERRLPVFATKHWACSLSDIDWRAEGIRSSALEFIAYSLGFFHDGHRAASDCRATLHVLSQSLPQTSRLALAALLEKARTRVWRLWARDAPFEMKDLLKARGYTWSPGDFGRPRCWFRDVPDAEKLAEVAWLRENAINPDQDVWALPMTARDRYSDRCGVGANPSQRAWMMPPVFPVSLGIT